MNDPSPVASAVGAQAAPGAAFPTRAVRILTPFSPGSGPDVAARLVAGALQRLWGQPVEVENQPGGNGFLAIDAFRRGAADGHDLLQLDNALLLAYPHLFKKLPYDPQRDFEHVVPLFLNHFFFVVAADSPYTTLGELIADAKARPGRVRYGSWSIGNPAHLGSALFESVTGCDMQHVICRDTSHLYGEVASGQLSFALGSLRSTEPLRSAGTLRFLAFAGPQRHPAFPDVPTAGEAGGPADFEVIAWTTIAAPKGLPQPLIDQLRRDFAQALVDPEVTAGYAACGYERYLPTQDEFAQFLRDESARFAEVIRASKNSLD